MELLPGDGWELPFFGKFILSKFMPQFSLWLHWFAASSRQLLPPPAGICVHVSMEVDGCRGD